MTRLLARWPIALLILAPLGACASTESDPNKIPEPVKATEGSGAAPGAVSEEARTADATTATEVKLHSGRASEPGAEECQPVRTPELITRVGGDMQAQVEIRGGRFRFGPSQIESPLPAGYPEPTPPGAIDIKRYPTVRRAEYVSSGNAGVGMNMGFFPLFNHIKDNDIAMTSPVEMDYRDMFEPGSGKQAPKESMSWTMSFLYRTKDLAPTGKDGKVVITDRPEITVLSIGMNGPYGTGVVEKGLRQLNAWLAEHPEWEVVGDPRAFHYNGPYISNRVKWSEVQLPVRRKDASAS
jgi:hypothetical protein